MNKKHYERLQETLYSEILPNGLRVFILPKKGFKKSYATFTANYGSVDNHFQVEDQAPIRVPDGIAHFLEHKMFEEPDGGDVFAKFSSQGASANAYTSFDRTAYLFSATEQIPQNLETLLNYVQNPYFTDENVEKEKGIIEQEINMYQDNPAWRVYFGLISSLYHHHPVRIDIAGTVSSIYQIDKEALYTCYNTFYHPSNMLLFVVGGIDPQETMQVIRDNQAKKNYAPQGKITRLFQEEPDTVKASNNEIQLSVSMPKCMIGIKDQPVNTTGQQLLQQECQTKLLMDILFSSSSALYQQLYDEKLISDNFGSEFNCQPGYAFSMIGGDTPDPEQLVDRIKQELERIKERGIDQDTFERNRRKKVGNFLRALNSPEAMANEFTRYHFRDIDFFDLLNAYESVTLEQVNNRLREHFDWSKMAVSVVKGQ